MTACFTAKSNQSGYCTFSAAANTSVPEMIRMDTALLAVSIILSVLFNILAQFT